jgi:GntR family transcriptional repressor for pyruvate dehydrogenase complex
VTETVSESIVEMVRSGQIKPGERLPSEHELMSQLNVGRSSLREAVRGLVMMGVLESRPRKGTVVVSPVPSRFGERLLNTTAYWAVRDLFEVRLLIEQHAAGVAASLSNPDDIADIAAKARTFEACVRGKRSYYQANVDFHLAIGRAARNPVLLDCLQSIIGNLREIRERINEAIPEMPATDVEDHYAIAEAIRKGDARRARKLMSTHISRYIDYMESAARAS